MSRFELHQGDCLDIVANECAPDSFDALVTDPPSGIGFLNQAWDSDRGGRHRWTRWLSRRIEVGRKVLKPGAHGLVWALPRTAHWTMTALEDSGFEIRDVITHHFGTGYPKSMNLDGGGTALKPATEFWVLVRKPLVADSVSRTFHEHGVGLLNIDATRIAAPGETPKGSGNGNKKSIIGQVATSEGNGGNVTPPGGRWPANVVLSHHEDCVELGPVQIEGTNPPGTGEKSKHRRAGYGRNKSGDEGTIHRYADAGGQETVALFECVDGCPVKILDAQAGELRSGLVKAGAQRSQGGGFRGDFPGDATKHDTYGDVGRASRFFYVGKPSRAERDAGLPEDLFWERTRGGLVRVDFARWNDLEDNERTRGNAHPTVKSIGLMRWMTRLVARPGQRVLDLFTGSGTTGGAALLEGCEFFGVEDDADFCELIARPRLAYYAAQGYQPSLLGGTA